MKALHKSRATIVAVPIGSHPRNLRTCSGLCQGHGRGEAARGGQDCHRRKLVVSEATAQTPAIPEFDAGMEMGEELDWIDDSASPPPSEETLEFAKFLAKVADQTKCENIKLYHVGQLIYWTDYFLIVTVFSKPQMNAILGKLEKAALEKWNRRAGEANPGRSQWEVLDFSDVVVHVMAPEMRDYYNLEGLYNNAEEISIDFGPAPSAPEWTESMEE